jgi:predicted dehydrogenase
MENKIRIGIAGLGVGRYHYDNYSHCDRAAVVAICDRDRAWLDHIGSQWGIAKRYLDYNEMFADPEIDAVSIGLPSSLHAEATKTALDKGKHVLCEKPMAVNAGEAKQMVSAAQRANRILMISQNKRFTPQARYLHQCVRNKRFGWIYQIRIGWPRAYGNFPSPINYRETGMLNRNWFNEKNGGGGVLRDLGSHLLDLSLWFLEYPPIDKVVSSNLSLFTPKLAAQSGHIADAS